MNSVVVRPARGSVSRAAVGSIEITSASCAAHWIAGGTLPSAVWILASALPVFGVGVLLHRGRLALPSALAGAAAGQAFLHLALAQGAATDHMGMTGSVWPMVIAHAVGALATVVLWSLRRQAWDVLVRVGHVRPPVRGRSIAAPTFHDERVDTLLRWRSGLRRGPPGRVFS